MQPAQAFELIVAQLPLELAARRSRRHTGKLAQLPAHPLEHGIEGNRRLARQQGVEQSRL